MSTDINGRRLQWGERQPKVKLFEFKEADYRAFELMAHHGALPSSYLIAATKKLRPDETRTKNRLTDLFHGSKTQGHFLDRPAAQFAQLNAHARHVVSSLAPKARALLESLGRLPEVPPVNSAWFVHQLMQATVGASFELCVPDGFRYLSRSELLTDERCGRARGSKNPMGVPIPGSTKTLTPDDLFGLEKDGRKRYFLVEVDRATESMDGAGEGTYFAGKLRTYLELYRAGAFKDWFGFNRPNLLIVTTNEGRARKILRYLAEFDEQLQERLFVTVEPSFGPNWRTPVVSVR